MKHRNTLSFETHFPRSLMESLTEIAKERQVSPSQVLQRAFKEWQNLENERRRLTLQSIADGDAGRVVPHEEVEAWMESLGTDNPRPFPHA